MNNVPKLRFKEFSEEWKSKKIKELTNYVDYRGKTPTKTETGVFLVTAKNIKQGFIDYTSSQEYISTDDYEEVMRRGKPLKGDVLLTTEAPLGNIAQIDREDIALAQRVIKFRGNELLDNGFLKHYMLGNKFQRLLEIKAIGTTVLGIQGKVLHSLPLTIPIKQEQEKIASFLTSIDTKMEQLAKKEELLQQYKKGVMQKIFNQEIRFKADDGSEFCEWEENKLGEICSIKKGSQLNKDTLTEIGDYPALNGGINPSGYTTDWNTEANTITISEGGNSCGYVNFVRTRFWSGGHNYSLQELENTINPKYLYQYLKFNELNIMKLRVGSGLPNIQKSAISSFNINIPCIEEQNKIANFLFSIDTKIEQVQKQLNFIKEFKKALLHQMFV
ncbi:restriction endonuclease subunit S [Aliarcobacter lanthieri]|uniref:restriction endonuclease subunit S n=1 Tax=Aliarcobacter lanthieri TaxID=1355374 RepID=UPI003AA89EE6